MFSCENNKFSASPRGGAENQSNCNKNNELSYNKYYNNKKSQALPKYANNNTIRVHSSSGVCGVGNTNNLNANNNNNNNIGFHKINKKYHHPNIKKYTFNYNNNNNNNAPKRYSDNVDLVQGKTAGTHMYNNNNKRYANNNNNNHTNKKPTIHTSVNNININGTNSKKNHKVGSMHTSNYDSCNNNPSLSSQRQQEPRSHNIPTTNACATFSGEISKQNDRKERNCISCSTNFTKLLQQQLDGTGQVTIPIPTYTAVLAARCDCAQDNNNHTNKATTKYWHNGNNSLSRVQKDSTGFSESLSNGFHPNNNNNNSRCNLNNQNCSGSVNNNNNSIQKFPKESLIVGMSTAIATTATTTSATVQSVEEILSNRSVASKDLATAKLEQNVARKETVMKSESSESSVTPSTVNKSNESLTNAAEATIQISGAAAPPTEITRAEADEFVPAAAEAAEKQRKRYDLNYLHSLGVQMTGKATYSPDLNRLFEATQHGLMLTDMQHHASRFNPASSMQNVQSYYPQHGGVGPSSFSHFMHQQPPSLTIGTFVHKDMFADMSHMNQTRYNHHNRAGGGGTAYIHYNNYNNYFIPPYYPTPPTSYRYSYNTEQRSYHQQQRQEQQQTQIAHHQQQQQKNEMSPAKDAPPQQQQQPDQHNNSKEDDKLKTKNKTHSPTSKTATTLSPQERPTTSADAATPKHSRSHRHSLHNSSAGKNENYSKKSDAQRAYNQPQEGRQQQSKKSGSSGTISSTSSSSSHSSLSGGANANNNKQTRASDKNAAVTPATKSSSPAKTAFATNASTTQSHSYTNQRHQRQHDYHGENYHGYYSNHRNNHPRHYRNQPNSMTPILQTNAAPPTTQQTPTHHQNHSNLTYVNTTAANSNNNSNANCGSGRIIINNNSSASVSTSKSSAKAKPRAAESHSTNHGFQAYNRYQGYDNSAEFRGNNHHRRHKQYAENARATEACTASTSGSVASAAATPSAGYGGNAPNDLQESDASTSHSLHANSKCDGPNTVTGTTEFSANSVHGDSKGNSNLVTQVFYQSAIEPNYGVFPPSPYASASDAPQLQAQMLYYPSGAEQILDPAMDVMWHEMQPGANMGGFVIRRDSLHTNEGDNISQHSYGHSISSSSSSSTGDVFGTEMIQECKKRGIYKSRNSRSSSSASAAVAAGMYITPVDHMLSSEPLTSNSTPRETSIITLPDRYMARAQLVELKTPPADMLQNSRWDNLSTCIWQKFTQAQQTEITFKKKIILWRLLYSIVKNAYPRFSLFLVGSTISGFGADNSDVDMCLVSRHVPHSDPRSEALFHLTMLRDFLINSHDFDNFNLIEAKVPILRFKDRNNQLEVDLNFNNSVGIKNTHLLYCYSQLDWRLRPLVLVAKLWAQFHNINNAKSMTISSYSLVLMVIHFLQQGVQPPVLPCLHDMYPEKFPLLHVHEFRPVDMNETMSKFDSQNKQTIGELFLLFLRYYSNFDYTQHAISIRTGGLLPVEVCRQAKSMKNDIHQWKELCIEEPFDLTNTARSVYDFETFARVKAVFSISWNILNQTMDLGSIFSPIIVPIPAVLPKPSFAELLFGRLEVVTLHEGTEAASSCSSSLRTTTAVHNGNKLDNNMLMLAAATTTTAAPHSPLPVFTHAARSTNGSKTKIVSDKRCS